MDIQKEFDRWWNTFKSQATRQYPVKAAREAWVACAMLMADRVKELELTCGVRGYDGLLKQLKEYEQQAKDNEGKDNIIIAELRQQLNEAVEIIKRIISTENQDELVRMLEQAEMVLAKLDLLEGEK
jgi:hypothetical protein